MIKRGRLRFLPRIVRPPKKVERVEGSAQQVAYFPGCSGDSHAEEYDHSTRASAAALGIELVEPPNWNCCGSCHVEGADPELAHVLPLRTVANVERMGLDTLTTPCSECFVQLKGSEQRAARDPEFAEKLGAEIGHTYRGGVKVQHLLSVILERAGLAKVKARVTKPLTGLKVACYYGCLMTRPSKVTEAAHVEYPMDMDALLRALGAEPVDWESKTQCCGNSLTLTQPSVGEEMMRKIAQDASDSGAEAIVAMCPMCHTNLDVRQAQLGLDNKIPVLYATQLMVLAFGLGAQTAKLSKHSVDPRPLLEKKNLLD
jgi:heterodisulfide reductase subunit B